MRKVLRPDFRDRFSSLPRCHWLSNSARKIRGRIDGLKKRVDGIQNSSLSLPALNFQALEEDAESFRRELTHRKAGDVDLDEVLKVYKRWKSMAHQRELLEMKRNKISKGKLEEVLDSDVEVAKLKDKAERLMLVKEIGAKLRDQIHEMKSEELHLKDEALKLAAKLPNRSHPDSPIGDGSKARIVEWIGEQRSYDFLPKDHIELNESLSWFDLDWSRVSSGMKTALLKDMGAAMEHALTGWAINRLRSKGFQLVHPPDILRREFVHKCGFLPGGEQSTSSHVYNIEQHDLCLSGTSELTMMSMLFDTIIPPEVLPLKLVGFSHCFRPESGSGHHTRGLYRLHQFSKIEMAVVCLPEDSEKMHQELLRNQIELFKELGLHCRVLDMPTEELGASAYRKYDIEAWLPGKREFGEISSTSNCTDYQSRRLQMRSKSSSKDRVFPHTLNGTGCAIPRTIIAIMEQHQQQDGSIRIPEALHPYLQLLGFEDFLVPSS